MKKLSWAIIGAGEIAGGFDRPYGAQVLTHVKALKKSAYVDIESISIVEPDNKRRNLFCKKWGISKDYVNTEQLLESELADVISVCTPPETHKKIIGNLCEAGVKVILCEKPLAPSYKDALSIVERCRKNGVKLIINYLRSFDPGHLWAINLVKKGRLGKIHAVTGYYTKGLFNNGSHLINLLRSFFGKIIDVKNLGGPLSEDAPYESPDFMTRHHAAQCLIKALDHRNYMLFELDIIGQKGRLRLIEKGGKIEWYIVARDAVYRGYNSLRLKKTFHGTFDKMMSYAIDATARISLGKDNFESSTMDEAAEDILLVEKILKRKA